MDFNVKINHSFSLILFNDFSLHHSVLIILYGTDKAVFAGVLQPCIDHRLIGKNTAQAAEKTPHDKLNGIITPAPQCADRGAKMQHELFLLIKIHEHVSVHVFACVFVSVSVCVHGSS